MFPEKNYGACSYRPSRGGRGRLHHHPERRSALTNPVKVGLREALATVADDDVRAVVLTGAGDTSAQARTLPSTPRPREDVVGDRCYDHRRSSDSAGLTR
jgi:hypothetical protein